MRIFAIIGASLLGAIMYGFVLWGFPWIMLHNETPKLKLTAILCIHIGLLVLIWWSFGVTYLIQGGF